MRLEAALQPVLRAFAQFGRLVDRRAVLADREARQDRRLRPRPKGATLRDFNGGCERLWQIREQRRHLGAGLEPVLGRELAAVGLDHEPALRDADQGVMSLVIFARGEQRRVGGDERNAVRIGQFDQGVLGHALARGTVALQFDIEAVAEQPRQFHEARSCEAALAGIDRGVERPARPAGERDQSVCLSFEPCELDVRLLARRGFQERAGIEPHQATVAVLPSGQQHDTRACGRLYPDPGLLVAEIDGERTADDRLDADTGHLLGEFQRPEHVVGVGERQRGLTVGLREFRQPRDGQRALQQRIGRMHVQVHEAGTGHLNPRDSRYRAMVGAGAGAVHRGRALAGPPAALSPGFWRATPTNGNDPPSQRGDDLRPDRNHPQE